MEDDLTWLVRKTKGEWPEGDTLIAKYDKDGGSAVASISGLATTGLRWFTKAEYLERKAELQNKPSWKDAPEWASHLAQSDSGTWHWMDGEPEINEIHDSGEFWSAPGYSVVDDNPRGEVLGDWRDTLEQRPADMSAPVVAEQVEGATWFERGELPPVGIWCEASCDGAEPEKCKVIAYHKQQVAVQWSQFNNGCLDVLEMPGWAFRPIRTEREKAIEEMMASVLAVMNHGLQRRLCEDLYDAGYRKQEDKA